MDHNSILSSIITIYCLTINEIKGNKDTGISLSDLKSRNTMITFINYLSSIFKLSLLMMGLSNKPAQNSYP